MRMNLEGRVEKISLPVEPRRNCLQPLFEAIVNAIHATDAAGRPRGHIAIHVERDKSQGVLRTNADEKTVLEPVRSFTVIDDGIGFDADNMKSFDEADSLHKKQIGGKGVGRLLWLKAFARVEVDSVYMNDGVSTRRTFRFMLADDGVGNESTNLAEGEKTGTRIRLIDMKEPYRDKCPKGSQVIADHIVQHCIEYLAQEKPPKLVLVDPEGEGRMDLNAHFAALRLRSATSSFELRSRRFQLRHFLLRRRPSLRHQIHFCADRATVTSENLSSHLPDLHAAVEDSESREAVIYHGYVGGDFLNETVTQERTDFHKITSSNLSYEGAIPWSEVVDTTVDQIADYLRPITEQVREAKAQRIREYVQHEAPQYRALLKHRPDLIEQISPRATGNALELELHKADQQFDGEIRQQAHDLLEADPADEPDVNDYREQMSRFIEKWNDRNKDQLARYVAWRKAILSYLHDKLNRQPDGRFSLEEDCRFRLSCG